MSWGDVRGLLQYVPQFRGQVFVVIVDAPVPVLAETMLDLVTLQNIGVQLVVASTLHSSDELVDRAAEVELKYCQELVDIDTDRGEALSTLKRGQAVFLKIPSEDALSSVLVKFACSLSAKKLILLRQEDQKIPTGAMRAAEIHADEPQALCMAAEACHAGIPRVHLLDGNVPGVMLGELFSNEGVGTMVYADSYRAIRPLCEEDIVELLGMIGRSVRNAHLVPRDYAAVASRIDDYYVMEIDGNVVGSVALYCYPDEQIAEIACLYVKQAHEGLGYGNELVNYAETQARDAHISSVFALTNRASRFFQRLGYEEWLVDEIPEKRRQKLLVSGRNSGVFGKTLV